MSVAADNARDDAKIALYKAITEGVEKAKGDSPDMRIARLKELAMAYGLVTFGPR